MLNLRKGLFYDTYTFPFCEYGIYSNLNYCYHQFKCNVGTIICEIITIIRGISIIKYDVISIRI